MLPSEYGLWVIFASLTTFLYPVLTLGFQDLIKMKFYSLDADGLKTFVFSAVVVSTAVAGTALLCTLVFIDWIENITTFPGNWAWSIVIVAYLYGLFYSQLAVLQFQKRQRAYVVSQLIQSTTTIALAVILLVNDWGWKGVIVAKALGLLTTNLFTLTHIFQTPVTKTHLRLNLQQLVETFKLGLKYLPAGVMPVMIPLTDRLVVSHTIDAAETGFFGIGASFAQVLWLFVVAFTYAWQPILFRNYHEPTPNSSADTKNISYAYCIVLPVGGLFVSVIAYLFGSIVLESRYESSYQYIGWMTVAVVCQGYYQLAQTFLLAKQKIKVMSVIAIGVIVFNIVFDLVMVKPFGGIGVALGTSAAFICGTIISMALLQSKFSKATTSENNLGKHDRLTLKNTA